MVELFLLAGIFFILGASVGSFLTVVIDRFQQGEQVVKGRSYCDFCKHTLGVLDLIPVVSYLLLRGRCRYCKKRLSFFYPIIESTTGILFALTILFLFPHFSLSSPFVIATIVYFLMLISILIVVFFSDMRYGIIPLPAIAFGVAGAFVYTLFFQSTLLLNYTASAILSCLFLFSIFFLTKGRGIGFGDVLYGFFMGFVLGFPLIVLSYYIAFLTGAIVSLILILYKRKKIRGSTIPFGPFLVLGTVLNMFFGQVLLAVIVSLFG